MCELGVYFTELIGFGELCIMSVVCHATAASSYGSCMYNGVRLSLIIILKLQIFSETDITWEATTTTVHGLCNYVAIWVFKSI